MKKNKDNEKKSESYFSIDETIRILSNVISMNKNIGFAINSAIYHLSQINNVNKTI